MGFVAFTYSLRVLRCGGCLSLNSRGETAEGDGCKSKRMSIGFRV